MLFRSDELKSVVPKNTEIIYISAQAKLNLNELKYSLARLLDKYKEAKKKEEKEDLIPVVTLNGLCISSLKEYLIFLKDLENKTDRKFNVLANSIVFPKWLGIDILNSTFKHYFDDIINWLHENYKDDSKNDLIMKLCDRKISLEYVKDYDLLGYFVKWIRAMDRRRNTNFLEIFPEFVDLVAEGEKHFRSYTRNDIQKWNP